MSSPTSLLSLPIQAPADALAAACLLSMRCLDPAQADEASHWVVDQTSAQPELAFKIARRLDLLHCLAIAYRRVHPPDGRHLFETYAALSHATYQILREAWRELHDAFQAAGISNLPFKGLPLMTDLLDESTHYLMADIDVLVAMQDVPRVQDVLQECGYTQRIVNAHGRLVRISPRRIQNNTVGRYELFPYTCLLETFHLDPYAEFIATRLQRSPFVVHDHSVYMTVEIDVHMNLEYYAEPNTFWRAPQLCPGLAEGARTLSDTTYAWYLPFRCYREIVMSRLERCRMLADCAALLALRPPNLAALLPIADTYNLEAGLYYTYRFLREQIALDVPEAFLAELQRQRRAKFVKGQRPQHRDSGDFVPLLLRRMRSS